MFSQMRPLRMRRFTMSAIFEPTPRWKNAPKFCIAAHRMAFATEKELHAFRSKIGMSAYPIKKLWKCEHCDCFHYDGCAPNPAGDSSGTGRSSK